MSNKTTLLVAPAFAPISGATPLACAIRDLARALQENGWSVTVALGLDSEDQVAQTGLQRAGLARRLEPLTAAGQDLVVSEGMVGDIEVLAFAASGAPVASRTLAAARALGQTPELVQLWTATAEALTAKEDAKVLVHHDDLKSAEGLEAADLILMPSRPDAKKARKGKESPFLPLADKIHGLAPGFDAREWNPERDSLLSERMDPPTAELKAAAKAALRKELGLKDADLPLIAVVSRFDKLPRALGAELIKMPLQIASIGGGPNIEALASRAPQVAACPKPLSDFERRQLEHRMIAAADFVLVPPGATPSSKLFPCRYGTAVIAHNSGEAGERIVNFDIASRTGSGFLYRNNDELMATIRGALAAWSEGPEVRQALVERCVYLDLSWQTAAFRFDELVAPLL